MALSDDDIGKLLRQAERCKQKKQPWDSFVLEMLQYICPRMTNKISGRLSYGTKQTTLQFDSTAEDAGQKLAASLAGSLTSAAQKWFRLVPREYGLRKIRDFMAWLEECADRIYAGVNNSNFNAEIAEVYLSLVYTGLAGMFMDEDLTNNALNFRTMGVGEFCYEEDAKGKVNQIYRNFDITYAAAAEVPGWHSAFTQEMKSALENKPEEEFEVLHCVYPRSRYNSRIHTSTNMPYASVYVGSRQKVLLEEGGFHEFPYAVPRWSKSPGEIVPRGPGHRAHPDVRTQNRLVELELEAGSKAVDPPLLVLHEAVIGDPTLNPAGINAVDGSLVGNDIRRAVMPLESAANFQWARERLDRLDKKIRDSFYGGLLEIPEVDRMSATEFAGRLEMIQRLLGPTFGRMNWELLAVIVNRVFNILLRRGAFPPPPPVPAEFQNTEIDVVFEGPLARAQRSHDLIAIQRKNEWILSQLNIGNTSVVDLFDADAEGREIAEITGLPSNIVRDDKDVAGIRAQKAQTARQQQAAASLQAIAEGAGKAAPALKEMPRTAQRMDTQLATAGNGAGAPANA